MTVKKRRSSSSPRNPRHREKVPHLETYKPCRLIDPFNEPSTSAGPSKENVLSTFAVDEKDVNLTAELFWLKKHLSEHWSMKWLWKVTRDSVLY